MSLKAESESLIGELSEAGYQSSVISTFNCYFPFYEEVVLRRLVAAGCTNNVLLVDAQQCAEAFSREELRPRGAGVDYTLIPVQVGGAFHPKMLLRIGKSRGSLYVGSHNLTLSGFGLNDEVTNLFRVDGPSARVNAGPLREAHQFLASFLPGNLDDVREAYESTRRGISWMEGPIGVGEKDRTLITSSSAGPSLWSKLVPHIPEKLVRVFVCAPFFDPNLAFVKHIQKELNPKELIIGIDPESVVVEPTTAVGLSGVRWVNVAGLPQVPSRREGSRPYLHAKICWFESKKGQLLVSGSANASAAAFLAPASGRNVEAIVADSSATAPGRLAIETLVRGPTISKDEWAKIADRIKIDRSAGDSPARIVCVATPAEIGFSLSEPISPKTKLQAFDARGNAIGEGIADKLGKIVLAEESVRDAAHYLEATGPNKVLIIVHRSEEILKHSGGDTRKALRHAFGGLEEDPGQLEALLKLAEKVIFDSEDVLQSPLLGTAKSAGTDVAEVVDLGAPASLALIARGKKSAKKKRKLASGDILALLDALIRRLGEGLPHASSPSLSNEEANIGADDEEGGELAREELDYAALSQVCRRKAARLIKRLEQQFERSGGPGQARRFIIQLATVLGVVRMLRVVEQRPEWKRMGLDLVDAHDESYLFQTAVEGVFWGENCLAYRALAETDGEWFEELSVAVGLLVWLAWDTLVDADLAFSWSAIDADEEENPWVGVQLLAALGPWFTGDEVAAGLLLESISKSPVYSVVGKRWLSTHLALLEGYSAVSGRPTKEGKHGRRVERGDLVILQTGQPNPRVVLAIREGTKGANVVLHAPGRERDELVFMASVVRSLPWPRLVNSAAMSA